jgi:ABC-type transport system involved in cytochrome c biogenesis permease subunit
MSMPLSETHLILAAAVCLAGSAALNLVGTRWRAAERLVVVLAFLCLTGSLAISAIQEAGWPLLAPGETIIASAAGAILWHLLNKNGHESKWGSPLVYAVVVALAIWGMARWAAERTPSMVDRGQPVWWLASRVALALACGAFVQAGSMALAHLVTVGQERLQALTQRETSHTMVVSGDSSGQHALLPGLSLLTASLLITAAGGQYTRGVAWSWTSAESWQLLAWLFYTIMWFAFVLLGWRGQRLWSLAATGLAVTLAMLHAVAG